MLSQPQAVEVLIGCRAMRWMQASKHFCVSDMSEISKALKVSRGVESNMTT